MIATYLDEPRTCCICTARTDRGVLLTGCPKTARKRADGAGGRSWVPTRAVCERCADAIARVAREGEAA